MDARPQRRRRAPTLSGLRDAGALLSAGAIYWLTIYPRVRRELREWERLAVAIPDRVLREQAMHKLTAERLNPEAAALFAVLAPRRARAQVVRLIVAYQLLYDYLDAVNELPECTSLRNGLLLHLALADAVRPGVSARDYYRLNARHDDGGYVHALAETCRQLVTELPAARRLEPLLLLAVGRVCDAQSHNHAVISEGMGGLIAWCSNQSVNREYLWWEIAAAGISCLGVHALFALAAHRRSTIKDAALVDAAYFPPVCALSALLDSLSDHYSDVGTPNHSFTARYRDSTEAAERFVAIAEEAAELIARLRHHRRHAVILTGIVAFYLSSASVREGFPAPVADRLIKGIGPMARAMRAVMRLRRSLHAGSDGPPAE